MTSVPAAIKRFLFETGVPYQFLVHPGASSAAHTVRALNVDPATVAVSRILRDAEGTALAVYPATVRPDLARLNRETGRSWQAAAPGDLGRSLPGCSTSACLPLAGLYHMDALVDERLLAAPHVHFPVTAQVLCRVAGSDFALLQGGAWRRHRFQPAGSVAADDEAARRRRRERIRGRIDALDELPAMPRIAEEILQLAANPYANASDLAAVVEQDPSLSAQLVRYANSPLYAYRGRVDSVRDVIARVLGYDLVLDISLGIAVGKSFRNPADGPLGLHAFWRHALYAAVLAQRLGELLDPLRRPRPGMTYLAGLLHNFGVLLLGDLFPEEFQLLNEAARNEPQTALTELEQRLLGISHMEIGQWLMEGWNMPDEVVVTIREHHNEEYDGPHAPYANLVLLANRALARIGLGDERGTALPGDLLARLGLSPQDVENALATVHDSRDGLDSMALQLAA